MLLRPEGATPPWARQAPRQQFDDDLAYAKWNFGGVALWEPPAGEADAALHDAVKKAMQDGSQERDGWLHEVCAFVCTNRIPLRVLLQALILVGALSMALWTMSATLRQLNPVQRKRGSRLLTALAVVTLGVGAALLSCDPYFESAREGNTLLILVAGLLILGVGRWIYGRRRGAR